MRWCQNQYLEWVPCTGGRTEKITGNFFYLRYTFRQSGVTARTCGKIKTVQPGSEI